jgi:WG containing repeat
MLSPMTTPQLVRLLLGIFVSAIAPLLYIASANQRGQTAIKESPVTRPSAPLIATPDNVDDLYMFEIGRCNVEPPQPNKAGEIIDDSFYRAGDFQEGFAMVPQGDGCGYINLAGQMAIAPKFKEAGDFSGGLAAVLVGKKWGFIDQKGKLAIAPRFQRVSNFKDGLAIAQYQGKQGFINRQGQWVIPPRFYGLSYFSNGLAIAKKQANGKYGYIDRQGKWAIQPQFTRVDDFVDGAARINAGGPGVYFINTKGQSITKPGQFVSAFQFESGLAAVAVQKEDSEYWGFIDPTGKLVIPCQFKSVGGFNASGLSTFIPANGSQDASQEKYGYIDRQGRVVIAPQFGVASSFNDGLAAVIMGGDANDAALMGYIDRTGRMVIKPSSNLSGLSDNGFFSEGMRQFKQTQDSKELWGYIDRSGNVIIAARFDRADRFYEGRAKVKIGTKWAYIDLKGNVIARQSP